MRILWLDKSSEHPWVEKDGWSYLEQSNFQITRVQFSVEARENLQKHSYDIFVVRAEVDGAMRVLEEVKCHSVWSKKTRVVVVSSKWKQEDFIEHAKMFIAADKYLNLPQPKVMFVQAMREVMGSAQPKPSALPNTTSPQDSDSRLEEIFSQSAPSENAPQSLSPPKLQAIPELRKEVSKDLPPGKPYEYQKKGSDLSNTKEEATGPILVSTPLMPSMAKNETDVAVIRKYLHMREEELALVLGEKQEMARENRRLQKESSVFQTRLREIEHSFEEMSRKVIHLEKLLSETEKNLAMEKESRELNEKTLSEKNKFLETQLSTESERYEELKNRVRKDIRKIRVKERDLEAKLEIARRDSETLLGSRDKRVLELQRKIDALEFDLDHVQDHRIQAESEAERYLAKLSRVARALHLAIGMIESDHSPAEDDDLQMDEPIMGGATLAPEAMPPASIAVEEESTAMDHLEELASDGEPTRVGSFDASELSSGEDSQVVSDDDPEKAIG